MRSPTTKEMCAGFGASSTNTAAVYLKVHVKKGALIKDGRHHKLANQVDWRSVLTNLITEKITFEEAFTMLEENPE